MNLLEELKRSKKDHEERMKLTTRFSYLIDKAIEQAETLEKIKEEAEDLYGEEIDLMDFGERVMNII